MKSSLFFDYLMFRLEVYPVKKSAFTIIELLSVIVIIGLLFVGTTYGTNVVTLKNKEGEVKDDFQQYALDLVERMSSGDVLSDICMVNETTYLNWAYGTAASNAFCFTDFGVMPVKSTVTGYSNYYEYNVNNILYNYLNNSMENMKVQFTDGANPYSNNFCSSVKTTKRDPWNNQYSVYGFSYKKSWGQLNESSSIDTLDMDRKDLIIVYSGGKDSKENKVGDYMLIVCKTNDVVKYATVGFSDNIGNAAISCVYPNEDRTGHKIGDLVAATDEEVFNAIGNDNYNITGDTVGKDSSRSGYYKLDDEHYAVHGFMRLGAI